MNIRQIIIGTALMCIPLAIGAYLCKPRASLSDQEIVTLIRDYPLHDIIKRCQKDFKYTDNDMVMLEQELKRFLILCSIKENATVTVNMYSEHVDNLWHTFILFTKEYAQFCNQVTGYFIHHAPRIESDELTPEKKKENYQTFCAFAKNYEKVFGEEIHPIWLLDIAL